MAYGIRVYDSSGNIQVDEVSLLERLVAQISVAAGASGSQDLSAYGVTSSNSIAFAVSGSTYSFGAYIPHATYISGTSVYWVANAYVSDDSIVYVMKYK